MEKITWKVLVVIFLLILSSVSTSRAGEVDGFRGMKWGTPIAEIRQSKQLDMRQDDGVNMFVFYSMVNDDLTVKGVNVESIRYIFWKDTFAGVSVVTNGEKNFLALKAAYEDFGLGMTGMGPSGEQITSWTGATSQDTVYYENTTGKGKFILLSKNINELKENL